MTHTVQLLTAAAASAGDKTAVNVGKKTPFLPNRDVIAHFSAHGQTGPATAWAIDGSRDNVTWVADICTSLVAAGHEQKTCPVYEYMRASVTTAAGTLEGTLSVWLEARG